MQENILNLFQLCLKKLKKKKETKPERERERENNTAAPQG